jgi:hypothetical protein
MQKLLQVEAAKVDTDSNDPDSKITEYEFLYFLFITA